MNFNKKLLALIIAHFAFVQFVFAMDDDRAENKERAHCKTATFVASKLDALDARFGLDSAVDNGSAACQGCGRGLLRVTRGTTTLALVLLDRADNLSSGRITKAKAAIAGYEKQAVEYGQSKNYNRIVSAYQWLKDNALYVMFEKLD